VEHGFYGMMNIYWAFPLQNTAWRLQKGWSGQCHVSYKGEQYGYYRPVANIGAQLNELAEELPALLITVLQEQKFGLNGEIDGVLTFYVIPSPQS
jgi:hypothetical protein